MKYLHDLSLKNSGVLAQSECVWGSAGLEEATRIIEDALTHE